MGAPHRSKVAGMGAAKNVGPLKSLPGNADLIGVHLPSSLRILINVWVNLASRRCRMTRRKAILKLSMVRERFDLWGNAPQHGLPPHRPDTPRPGTPLLFGPRFHRRRWSNTPVPAYP